MAETTARQSFRRTVLDNGIRVVTERVDTVRSVSLGVWVRAGSRDENPQEAGISHFLEHAVFKGTGRRSGFEIAQALESVGGCLDAFTSREHTCYLARVLGENLPLAIDVISDLMGDPALAPESIDLEKQVVIEEIRSLNDLPDELVHERFSAMVWHDHPLKNPVLGTEESVSSFTSASVRQYLEGRYTPGRMVVAAAGFLDHEEVVGLVSRHLGSLSREPAAPASPRVEAFQPVVMDVRDISQEHIYIGCRSPSFAHPDRYAMLLLASLLGGGMSSRLYQSVREQSGLAYAISSYAEFLTDSGLFGTYVAVSSENTPAAVRLILREMARLRTGGVGEEELEGVKAQIIGGMMIGMEGMNHRMSRLAKAETNDRPIEEIDAMVAAVRAVSADDVVRVLGESMSPGRICLVGLGPVDRQAVSDIEIAC